MKEDSFAYIFKITHKNGFTVQEIIFQKHIYYVKWSLTVLHPSIYLSIHPSTHHLSIYLSVFTVGASVTSARY